MEIISLHPDDYLFFSGKPCREIFIICNGELEIRISNKSISVGSYLDTLYSGCSIGSYSALSYEDYIITGRAMVDCTVLKLDFGELEIMREKYEDLDAKMLEYEKYIEKNGLPYCDYKFHRNKQNDEKPIVKFRNGIKRIMRIQNSYKSSVFTDLLKNIQEAIRLEKREKEKSKMKKALHSKPQTHEEKIEQWILNLSAQVESLTQTVNGLKTHRH
jgi:hypothetical protein